MRRWIPILSLIAGCLGGGSGEITSFDPGTVVGALSENDFGRLCAQIDAWNDRQFGSAAFRRQQCEIEVVVAARSGHQVLTKSECQAWASSCEVGGKERPTIPRRCLRGRPGCAATVGEVEQCLADLAYNMYGLLLTAPMCDDPCRDVNPLTVDAASCATVRATCPELDLTRPHFEHLAHVPRCGS